MSEKNEKFIKGGDRGNHMSSKTAKALSLTAALSLAANPAGDLGDATKKAFNEFFGSGKTKLERTVNDNYGTNAAYAAETNSLDGKVDTTTYWTPAKLRDVINDNKITFVYWRQEGWKFTPLGDKFFSDFLRDYGAEFDRIILVEGKKYPERHIQSVEDVLNEFNPKASNRVHYSPKYSITGFGKETRISGPPEDPDEETYKKNYETNFRPFATKTLDWFKTQKLKDMSSN